MTRYYIQKQCESGWPTLHVTHRYLAALLWCNRYERKNKDCALRIVRSVRSTSSK